MNVLKNDFKIRLQNKHSEGLMVQAHKYGLRNLTDEAKRLSQDKIKKEDKQLIE